MQEVPSDVIERCRRGEVAALGQIYDQLGARTWRVSRNLLGSEAEADDLTQEVFLRLFSRIQQFEGRASFATWLHRTTVNLCLNRLEVRNRRKELEQPLDHLPVDGGPASNGSPASAAESADELEAWLGPLDAQARAILVLREVEGLEYLEIAAALEIPVGTVMSRLSRAREKLAQVAARRLGRSPARTGGRKT